MLEMNCLLGSRVEVIQNRMGNVGVLPNHREGNEVDPPEVVGSLGVDANVGMSFAAVKLREGRRTES